MATRIFYPNGTTEVIPESIGSDENYANGTYDFFDVNGKLLRQIPMDSRITWQPEEEPVIDEKQEVK